MRDDVKDLITKIESDDASVRENAITDLMFKVENSTKNIINYGTLGDEYMTQDEQLELIHVLIELAESLRPEYAGLLWVISKALPILTTEPVQDFVLKHIESMPTEMIYQSLVALQNSFLTSESADYETVEQKLNFQQLNKTIRRLEMNVNRLDSMVKDTLSNLEFYTPHKE